MSSTEDGRSSEPRVRPNNRNRDREVGYGRLPRARQFKPGHSGNPKGRPKGAKNESIILRDIFERKDPEPIGRPLTEDHGPGRNSFEDRRRLTERKHQKR